MNTSLIFEIYKMKRIIIFRHAKSSWNNSSLNDHERPLIKRGINAAHEMGKFIKKENLIPDIIFCSTAERAKQTLELASSEFDKEIETIYKKEIYTDGLNYAISNVKNLPEKLDSVMFVGHSPDCKILTTHFTGNPFPYPKFSTAGIVVIEFDVNTWNKVKKDKGKLKLFQSPKML